MTIGPGMVVDLVAGIVSVRPAERRGRADSAGFELRNPWGSGIDDDEARVVAPAHLWAMCIEPSVDTREGFLHSIDWFAGAGEISSVLVAEVAGWLAVTGTSRAEVDYVETFEGVLVATGAVPEVPLTPERSAPLVDVLRGITSAAPGEREQAAGWVPELLGDLRADERRAFTGVLARAAVVEDVVAVRTVQLEVLAAVARRGGVHARDAALVGASLDGVALSEVERAAVGVLAAGRPQ